MGFVTILVQHSWSLQPNSKSKPAQTSHRPKDRQKNINVRLTEGKTVSKLIEKFNRSDSAVAHQSMEVEIRDVLDRLAKLSLQSCIVDTARIDPIRVSLNAVKKLVSSDLIGQDKTRLYAAQARISLVAYAHCINRHLSDKALNILLEALDTNRLSFDGSESSCLFQLIIQLTRALQVSIDKARSEDTSEMRVAVDGHMERLLKVNMISFI